MDGDPRRDFVSRERYDLLLEEAQAVERERARLEAEVQRAEVHQAGLERDLGHSADALTRAEERLAKEAGALHVLETQLGEVRTERAVDAVRLERLNELSTRASELEQANAKLAFALKDASQGYRQFLLEAGDSAPKASRRAPRLATVVGAALGLLALIFGGFQLGELRSSLAAERDARREQVDSWEERERNARTELGTALGETVRQVTDLKDSHTQQLRLAEEAATARMSALEARLGEDRALWQAERSEILSALEVRNAEIERLAEAVREATPPPVDPVEEEASEAAEDVPAASSAALPQGIPETIPGPIPTEEEGPDLLLPDSPPAQEEVPAGAEAGAPEASQVPESAPATEPVEGAGAASPDDLIGPPAPPAG